MHIKEVTGAAEPAMRALRQKEQAMKKQKATLKVQRAMKQLQKVSAAKPPKPAPSVR